MQDGILAAQGLATIVDCVRTAEAGDELHLRALAAVGKLVGGNQTAFAALQVLGGVEVIQAAISDPETPHKARMRALRTLSTFAVHQVG